MMRIAGVTEKLEGHTRNAPMYLFVPKNRRVAMSDVTKYQMELMMMAKFLKEARGLLHDRASIRQLDTLIQVALNPDGVEQQRLIQQAQLERSTASSNIAALTTDGSGPGLVESQISTHHRSARIVRLTAHGAQALTASLKKAFGEKA